MITAEEARKNSERNAGKRCDSEKHIRLLLGRITDAIVYASCAGLYEVKGSVEFIQYDMEEPDTYLSLSAISEVKKILIENGFTVNNINQALERKNIWDHDVIPTRNYKFYYNVDISWEIKGDTND